MDGHRFDGLTRALSSGLSRRQTLAVLGAALTGSGLLAAFPEEAPALSRKQRRRCKRAGGAVCSAGTRKSECCSPSGVCVNGACACDPVDNTCPNDATEQCHCAAVVGGGSACCDSDSCCDIDTPCTSNANCTRPGSFCAIGCGSGATPNTCTNPCIPGGSSA